MFMLDSGVDVATAAKASVLDVPSIDDGMIGGIVAASVGGAEGTIGAISGGWEVNSPYLVCTAFSNSCSI